jgi:alkaline phosphatase
MAIPTTL